MSLSSRISNYLGEDEDRPPSFDLADREKMVEALKASDKYWKEATVSIDLCTITWRPDLIKNTGSVCHLHTTPILTSPWVKRIEAAKAVGREVMVAAPLDLWYSNNTLVTLDRCEIKPIIIVLESSGNSSKWVVTSYSSVAELIAMNNLKLDGPALREMGQRLFARSFDPGNSDEVGTRFEDFLSLLFSQVSYFEVYKRDFENRTEEIDIVIKNRRVNERSLPNSPIVLISAKNTKESVGVRALNSLHAKMTNRRGMCKLGFLCASRAIAVTVAEQELRFSREDKVIVTLDGSQLQKLVEQGEQLDDEIEKLVLGAALA